MKIGIIGTGYIGLTNAACFAERGYLVRCYDIDSDKILNLQQGLIPIFEPDLEALIKKNLAQNSLQFLTDLKVCIQNSDVLLIAVGTSGFDDGSVNISAVISAVKSIAEIMTSYKLIVIKSTVPMGTTEKLQSLIQKTLTERNVSIEFDVASNPEFLREGSAIQDCLNGDRVIIGVNTIKAETILTRLFQPFTSSNCPLIVMDPASSELTKYAANAMLATKISLMNELSRLCEKTGANIESVRQGVGADHRIGPFSIHAGLGYGGSCFPKDVNALINFGTDAGESLDILKAVKKTNDFQRQRFIDKIFKFSHPDATKTFALWGVSFKPMTDDIREAPALAIIDELLKAGSSVHCFDPAAESNTLNHYHNHPRVRFFNDQYAALENCTALVIPTEWTSFKNPDFHIMREKMLGSQIFDGRNLYNTEQLKTYGFEYHCIGRS